MCFLLTRGFPSIRFSYCKVVRYLHCITNLFQTNSFQCALASDGVNSYAIFSFGSLGWGSNPGQALPAAVSWPYISWYCTNLKLYIMKGWC